MATGSQFLLASLQRADRTAEERGSFVSIGTDSYGTYSMTALTVQKSRKKTSEDGRIMIFEKACGLLSAAMIVGIVALPIGSMSVAHAQELAMGRHCSV
jgi:hypothetical protein